MRYLIVIIIAMFLMLLQTTPWYQLIGRTIPSPFVFFHFHLSCLLAIYLGLRSDSVVKGALTVFMVGYLADAFGPYNLHLHAFLSLLAYFLVFQISQLLYFGAIQTLIPFICIICFTYNLFLVVMMRSFAGLENSVATLPLLKIFLQTGLEGMLGYPLIVFLDHCFGSWSHVNQGQI